MAYQLLSKPHGFLGVPRVLDRQSISPTENPLGKYRFQWKIPEISLVYSPLGLMVLGLRGDSRAHLHPSYVLAFKHVPCWLLGSELRLFFLWSVVTVKEEELLAYAVQTVSMPKAVLNSKGISSTDWK